MKLYFIIIVLFFCSIQTFYCQEDDGVVSLALPVRNSLTFNRYLLNPTFSFVREQDKYINITNKREWVQFEDAPTTYFANYSGRLMENIGVGVGLFQENRGVLTTFGGVLNFAYNAQIQRDNNLTFGLNVGAYSSGLNTGSVVTNFSDPSLDNVPSNFLVAVSPGINYGFGFFDFGVSINNAVLYNLNTSELIQDDPQQAIQGHLMYTGYLSRNGFFGESKFSALARSQFRNDDTVISGLVMLTVPKGIWAQAGYNTLFGASAGLGLNITENIAVEYNYEQALGDLTDFGPSHEITLAYRFVTRERYDYSSGDEVTGIFSKQNKRVGKPTNKIDNAQAEANRKLAQERRAQKKLEAELAKEAQQQAEQQAEIEAQKKAQEVNQALQQAQAEEEAYAKRIAEQKKEDEARKAAVEQQRLKREQEAEDSAEAEASKIERERIRKEEEDRQRLEAEKAAAEQERLRLEQEARLKAEAEEAADEQERIRLQEEAKAAAEKERLKLEQEAKEKVEAEALAAEQEKIRQQEEIRKAAEVEKLAAENQAREVAAQEAERIQLEEEAKADSQNDTDNEPIPTDDLGKSMVVIAEKAEASQIEQKQLLDRLSEAVNSKNQDLKDLKKENDLSEQGIVSAPKPFKSLSAENAKIEALKSDLNESIENRNNEIEELQKIYDERVRIQSLRNDEVTLTYKRKIERLKAEQAAAIATKNNLTATLADIKVATEIERKRRIKRAVYDSDKDRYEQDRAKLRVIKQTTQVSSESFSEEDFDFGEAESDNIKILKNVQNIDSGYYLIVAVHDDSNKRDEFVRKSVAAGRADVDFFYDVNTSKYYIYYKKFDTIGQANSAVESKTNKPYNAKMSIVRIEN